MLGKVRLGPAILVFVLAGLCLLNFMWFPAQCCCFWVLQRSSAVQTGFEIPLMEADTEPGFLYCIGFFLIS